VDTVAVTVGDTRALALAAVPGAVLCEGDSAAIDAGPGYPSYRWTDSSGAEVGRGRSLIVRRTGEFSVTAVDSGGCRSVGSIRIIVHALPAPLISGPASLCDGDTATLDAGAGWRSVAWSTGDTGRTIRVARAGSYTATVIDSNGCAGVSAPFRVAVHAAPAPPLITQHGDTLTCSPAATYQWFLDGVPIPGATSRDLRITRDGRYTVRITDGFGCAAEASLDWSAPAIIVELPVMEAAPGDRIVIPITARPVQQLAGLGITGFRTSVRFHGGLLAPAAPTESGFMDGGQRVVSLDCSTPPSDNPIGTITGTVMLGPVDETPLAFDSFEFTGAPVRVTRIDGKLTVRVCREGGARLFDGAGRLALEQNAPNPFNASTRITFELIERGPTRLLACDMLGRCAVVLLDGPMEPGRHAIDYDASALASGAYVLTLQTPSATLVRIMLVKK
jgi:hypothetical protein